MLIEKRGWICLLCRQKKMFSFPETFMKTAYFILVFASVSTRKRSLTRKIGHYRKRRLQSGASPSHARSHNTTSRREGTMDRDKTGVDVNPGRAYSNPAAMLSLVCGVLIWITILYAMAMVHSMSPGMGDFINFLMLAMPLTGTGAGLFAILRKTSRRAIAWTGLLFNGAFLVLYIFLFWLSLN